MTYRILAVRRDASFPALTLLRTVAAVIEVPPAFRLDAKLVHHHGALGTQEKLAHRPPTPLARATVQHDGFA
jgi:hypothetical protein